MSVRSDRLAGPSAIPAGVTAVLFTVPPNETWLVKRVCLSNSGIATGVFYLDVFVGALAAAVYSVSIASARADDHDTWWALDPGAQLRAFVAAPITGTAMVFGAKLLGAA